MFQLKLTTFTFRTKFSQKEYFQTETEKVDITIEFSILELDWGPNSNSNWQL